MWILQFSNPLDKLSRNLLAGFPLVSSAMQFDVDIKMGPQVCMDSEGGWGLAWHSRYYIDEQIQEMKTLSNLHLGKVNLLGVN